MANVIRKLIPVFVLILSHPLFAAPKVDKEDLKQLRGRIETLQKELADKEESRSEAADALQESERAISAANRKLATLGREQHEASIRLDQLQARSGEVAREIEAQQMRLGKLVHRQYIGGGAQGEYLGLLLNSQDPNEISRDLHYYGHLSRARMEEIDTLRKNLLQLDSLTRESSEKSAEITRIQARQAEQKESLEQEKTAHAKLLQRISVQVDQQRREITKLKRDEKRLSQLVERLAQLLERQKRAAPPGAKGTLSNNRIPDSSTEGSPFSSLKGRLSLPVIGELANRFGGPRADGGVTWKGLFIRSAAGEDVKAVAGGRVVFADWLRGFGNLMIVDHGGSYMSLYGNNETIYKQVGDPVRGGDTIASVGNSGGNPDPGLYFELRHQGKPFDPLKWVRIK